MMMLGRRLAQVHDVQRRREVRERETFIALRACRKAVEIARRVRFRRPIDVTHTYCQSCGGEVDCSKYDGPQGLNCSSCGESVRVPGHVRGLVRVAPDERELEQWQWEQVIREASPEEAEFLAEQMELERSWRYQQFFEPNPDLAQIEWNFIKICAVTLLALMTIGSIIFFGIFVASR